MWPTRTSTSENLGERSPCESWDISRAKNVFVPALGRIKGRAAVQIYTCAPQHEMHNV